MPAEDGTLHCAAGDGPIVLSDGETMVSTSSGDWHQHCYRAVQQTSPPPLHDYVAWLSEWFENNLTWDSFKSVDNEDMAARLSQDMDAANWKVFYAVRVPVGPPFRISGDRRLTRKQMREAGIHEVRPSRFHRVMTYLASAGLRRG